MQFNISFLNRKIKRNNELGSITMGDFTEDLIIPTSRWSKEDYERQWAEALHSLMEKDEASTALITEIYPQGTAVYVNTWPIYRIGGDIYVQNRLIILDDYPEFAPENLQDYVHERETISEDGDSLSEWKLSVGDIKTWLESKNA